MRIVFKDRAVAAANPPFVEVWDDPPEWVRRHIRSKIEAVRRGEAAAEDAARHLCAAAPIIIGGDWTGVAPAFDSAFGGASPSLPSLFGGDRGEALAARAAFVDELPAPVVNEIWKAFEGRLGLTKEEEKKSEAPSA